jgi:hypothetical protein
MSMFCAMAHGKRESFLFAALVASAIVGWAYAPALAAVPSMSIADAVSADGMVTFVVTLSAPVTGHVGVKYQTADDTAVAGRDYTETHGILVFPPNVLSMPIPVPVVSSSSGDLVFSMNLSGSSLSTISRSQAIGTITAAKPGCGFGVGPANLIGFYVLTWAGLAVMKVGLQRPKRIE